MPRLGEIDLNGRRTTNPCFNNPDYRAYLSGKIESLLIGYPDEVDGIAWGCERMGPLDSMIDGGGEPSPASASSARPRPASSASPCRARKPATANSANSSAPPPSRSPTATSPPSGASCSSTPKSSAGSHCGPTASRGAGGALRPGQSHCAAKALRLPPDAEHDLQPVLPRRRGLHQAPQLSPTSSRSPLTTTPAARAWRPTSTGLSRGIFHDAKPEDFLALYYKIMNYNEAPFDKLASVRPVAGLRRQRDEARADRRCAGQTKIYPGIDIDVPVLGADATGGENKRTHPDDVKAALQAAFAAGADGVVLSREYVEMWLANLTAAGDTLKEIFAQQASKA